VDNTIEAIVTGATHPRDLIALGSAFHSRKDFHECTLKGW
jgi:hypothetical protein